MNDRNTNEFDALNETVLPPQEAEARQEDVAVEDEAPKFQLNFDEEAFDQTDVLNEEEKQIHKKREGKKPKRKKRSAGPMKLVFYTVSIIGVSVLLATAIWLGLNDVFAFNKSSQTIRVEIERGSSTQEIAQTLKEHGLIRFPFLFQFVSKMSENDGKYQYGVYELRPDMGYDALMLELQKNAPKTDVLSLTIKEGQTLREIADLLAENRICTAEDFLAAVEQADFGYRFEDRVEDDPLKFHRMEGYLFPDTYEFFIGEDPEDVVQKMLRNFNNKITADLYGRMEDLGWTLEETITLASLIQAESGQSQQMRKVSSVFWNRLDDSKKYPKLQSDVTIFYVEENIKPYEQEKNQEMYDAYNTYVCESLPVGPICNPGLEAIRAALYPEDTQYYYFVTDAEGNFYYAKTLAQHQQNCKKAGVSAD